MPELAEFIAGITLVALVIYVLTGGADFGGGIWDLLAFGKKHIQQEIADAIAPIWEANHVWLIFLIVVLFTAFPLAFSTMMTALHIPLTLVLVGIVLRGSAFVFRKYGEDQNFTLWSVIFGVASLMSPFFLGIVLGAVSNGGIRLEDGSVIYNFTDLWMTPFTISCGLLAQTVFAYLAAVYLTIDQQEKPALQAAFRVRAIGAWVAVMVMAVIVFVISHDGAPHIYAELTGSAGILLVFVAGLCAAVGLRLLWVRQFTAARIAAVLQVTILIFGWGLAQYPYLIYDDVTITQAAAPEITLKLLVGGLIMGSLILFPSLYYLFYIFKREQLGQG